MPGGQHESVAVRPVGMRRRVVEEARPERVGHRGHPHRGPRMARVRLLDAIDGERPDGVDREPVELFGGEGHAGVLLGGESGRGVDVQL